MNRRSLLIGIAAGVAPAIIRIPGLLMPVKALMTDGVALENIAHPEGLDLYPAAAMDLNEAALEYVIFDQTRITQMRNMMMPGLRLWYNSRAFAEEMESALW